jgi:ribosomal protein S27E
VGPTPTTFSAWPLNQRLCYADSSGVNSRNESHPRPAATLAVYCRSCSSPLVQASGWAKTSETHWQVRLWCPECWHEQTVVLDRAQAAYLSLAVEEGFACVLEAFEGLDTIVITEPDTRRHPRPS